MITHLWHRVCHQHSVSVNKTPISRTRTLLIILGIVLAFILTLNASSLFTAGVIPSKQETPGQVESPSDLNGKVEKAGVSFVHFLAEKFTTLK
ncbi:MAG: hypothetical protein ABJP45_17370 [Cyclobacteriaceae bacterium]